MNNFDLEYICASIGNLSGIPVRLYAGSLERYAFSMVRLPKDPLMLHLEEVLSFDEPVSYFATENLNYYGVFTVGDYKIILGPTRLVPNTDQELHETALQLELPACEIPAFVTAMKSIVGLPIERLLQMLCLLHYLINREQMKPHDISIHEAQQDRFARDMTEEASNELMELGDKPDEGFYRKVHNTYQAEATMIDIISKGDLQALDTWLKSPSAVQSGLLASDPIRQQKNTFISTATLASRAAIQGGMDQGDALSLSASYIQKCELLHAPEAILNLQYHMLLHFTERVSHLHLGSRSSKLVTDVANYVQHHLSTPVTTQEIADALFLSRPYLSKRFKKETGQNLTDFITKQKIDEAKRLLTYSNKSILSIAVYLGFSSQSHFTKVFKQKTGKTPGEWRLD